MIAGAVRVRALITPPCPSCSRGPRTATPEQEAMTVDRESEPGALAEAEPNWFDTPAPVAAATRERTWFDPEPDPEPEDAAGGDMPPRERTWFDDLAPEVEKAEEKPGDPDRDRAITQAVSSCNSRIDPKWQVAVLAEVGLSALRDNLLPEPSASEAFWKLVGLEGPTEARPYATWIAAAAATARGLPDGRDQVLRELRAEQTRPAREKRAARRRENMARAAELEAEGNLPPRIARVMTDERREKFGLDRKGRERAPVDVSTVRGWLSARRG
jgi:hypothetical protein